MKAKQPIFHNRLMGLPPGTHFPAKNRVEFSNWARAGVSAAARYTVGFFPPPLCTLSLWAIGDIHGCYETLRQLLAAIEFNPKRDRLWLTGDLVNRGPRSLDVLRWAVENQSSITCVLGNHDLKLLTCASGPRTPSPKDTFHDVLEAPDRGNLIRWLRHRPFLHTEGRLALVHAGLLPVWSMEQARRLAGECEAALRGSRYERFLKAILTRGPRRWRDTLRPPARWRALAGAFSYLRTCDLSGQPAYDYAGPLPGVPSDRVAWFSYTPRRNTYHTICFGHWAALGLYMDKRVIGLDSGCAWGGWLSAVRLSDRKVVQVPFAD